MKPIRATLPALGSYVIKFHDESKEVLQYLGKEEFRRLSNVDHLGMVSKVFTGVNHSRLEYTLLQCAVVALMKNFQRGDGFFATSGQVKLSGLKEKISSGEELLKCWFLLGNSGHAQYTFTSETILLDLAHKNIKIKQNILSLITDKELKDWANSIIENRGISRFYLVIALVRVGGLKKNDRRKNKFSKILKSLVLPAGSHADLSNDDLYKLNRLKKVHSYIRLLCVVTLDAYYSHHPIRFDIMSMVMNMSNLFDVEVGSFYPLLERTAGWLADELYLHPTAIAVQRSYEFNASKINQATRIQRLSDEKLFNGELKEILDNGFGEPDDVLVGTFKNLVIRAKRNQNRPEQNS